MPIRPPAANSRNLVTVLAWSFIALSGFGVFVGILQNLMLHTVFADPKFADAFSQAQKSAGFPPVFAVLLSHMGLFAAVFLAGALVTLVASIGLLKRRNWARIAFIGLLALGIAWTLAGTVFQLVLAPQFAPPPEIARTMPDFKFLFGIGIVFNAIWSLGVCGLFGWLIKRLVSADIAAEFRR